MTQMFDRKYLPLANLSAARTLSEIFVPASFIP